MPDAEASEQLAFELARRDDVQSVLRGKGVGVELDETTIREFAGRHQWADGEPPVEESQRKEESK